MVTNFYPHSRIRLQSILDSNTFPTLSSLIIIVIFSNLLLLLMLFTVIDQVVGTHGYAAPEYIETGHLTIKSDVWSFGVVMYEILTGRRSLEVNRPKSEQRLLDWVRQFPPDTRKFSMIIDPRLRNEYPLEAAREIAKLANSCLTKNAKARPSMSEVVETLRRATQITAKGS